jgi:ribosomal protein L24E
MASRACSICGERFDPPHGKIVSGPNVAIYHLCARRSADLLVGAPPGTLREADGHDHGFDRCSFCACEVSASGAMIAWPQLAICTTCLALIDEIVNNNRAPQPADAIDRSGARGRTPMVRCSFCGQVREEGSLVHGPGSVAICRGCAEEALSILYDESSTDDSPP